MSDTDQDPYDFEPVDVRAPAAVERAILDLATIADERYRERLDAMDDALSHFVDAVTIGELDERWDAAAGELSDVLAGWLGDAIVDVIELPGTGALVDAFEWGVHQIETLGRRTTSLSDFVERRRVRLASRLAAIDRGRLVDDLHAPWFESGDEAQVVAELEQARTALVTLPPPSSNALRFALIAAWLQVHQVRPGPGSAVRGVVSFVMGQRSDGWAFLGGRLHVPGGRGLEASIRALVAAEASLSALDLRSWKIVWVYPDGVDVSPDHLPEMVPPVFSSVVPGAPRGAVVLDPAGVEHRRFGDTLGFRLDPGARHVLRSV